jgi:hypothetical protein
LRSSDNFSAVERHEAVVVEPQRLRSSDNMMVRMTVVFAYFQAAWSL